MDTPQLILALLGTAGGSAALATFSKGLVSWVSGKAGRERLRNSNLLAQNIREIERREKAEKELEDERDLRFEAEEHISKLQRQIHLLGAEPVKHGTDRKQKEITDG